MTRRSATVEGMGRKAPARFNQEEIGLALRTVALYNGNTRRASKALKGKGLDVAYRTLHNWITTRYVDDYARVFEEELPNSGKRAAPRFEEIAERSCVGQPWDSEGACRVPPRPFLTLPLPL